MAGNFAHTLARTGGNRLSTPTPLRLQEFACRLRRGWSAASARAQRESAAASRSRGGAGLENPGAAAGRGRGRGRGRPPSCAARRARTWTPAAPAYTPGLRGLPRRPSWCIPRRGPPGPPRPARASGDGGAGARSRMSFQGKKSAPRITVSPAARSRPARRLPPPAPGGARPPGHGRTFPAPRRVPFPRRPSPPAPASPCALSRRCHLLPSSFPRSRGAREHRAGHPQGAGSPETPLCARGGLGPRDGWGRGDPLPKAQMRLPSSTPRGLSGSSARSWRAARPFVDTAGPASGLGCRDAIPAQPAPRPPPVPPPPHRELFVPDKAAEAGAQPQPREPPEPLAAWSPPWSRSLEAPGQGGSESAPSSLSEHPGSSAPWRRPSNTTRPRLGKSDCPPRAARKQSRPSRQPGAQRREGEGEGEREGSAWGPGGSLPWEPVD